MKILVRDNLDNDVTHEREWYINTDGKIFYYTGDIDAPLYIVDNDYTFEVVYDDDTGSVIEEHSIYRYPFVVSKDVLDSLPKADVDRIAKAKENVSKYTNKQEE